MTAFSVQLKWRCWCWPSFCTSSTQNLKCRQLWKVCPSKRQTTFVLADFLVCRWILENAAKIPEKVLGRQGFNWGLTMHLIKVWPKVRVDLIKMIISGCWLGFRGHDPGWPRFDESMCLTRTLALMMLLKNLGRHSLPPLKRISSWDSKSKDKIGKDGFYDFWITLGRNRNVIIG
jgi:hypothetical protein